jgi:hypothetical protein
VSKQLAGIHNILAAQRPNIDVCPGSLKANTPVRWGQAVPTMQDSRVTLRVDQNGAEELTPPGQAILVCGMETFTVMSPYLPDDERAQRLNALRLGEIELSDAQREKLALQAARGTRPAGKKPAVRGVYDRLKGRVGWNNLVTILGSLRERGLLLTKGSHKKADPKVKETGHKKTSVTMRSRRATQDSKGFLDSWGLSRPFDISPRVAYNFHCAPTQAKVTMTRQGLVSGWKQVESENCASSPAASPLTRVGSPPSCRFEMGCWWCIRSETCPLPT